MRRSKDVAAPGFTLAELLVSVTLMAVVLSGLFSLQDTLLRDQGKVMRDIAVRNQADYMRRMLLRDIGEATVIQSPTRDTPDSTELIGWKNLDPFNMNCTACLGGACMPNGSCVNACVGAAPAQAQNWTSLVDLPKQGEFPDASGTAGPNGARLFGDDTMWFRYCLTTDGRLMYYRGAVRVGVTNAVVCPVTTACDAGCGATPSPNCTVEQVAGNPVRVTGGFGTNLFRRRASRDDWIEANIHISTATGIGGLLQGTSVQVVLSAQMLRGTR